MAEPATRVLMEELVKHVQMVILKGMTERPSWLLRLRPSCAICGGRVGGNLNMRLCRMITMLKKLSRVGTLVKLFQAFPIVHFAIFTP